MPTPPDSMSFQQGPLAIIPGYPGAPGNPLTAPWIDTGSGDPNGSRTGPTGALFLRLDGPGGLYRCVGGSSWVTVSSGAGGGAVGPQFVLQPGGVAGPGVYTTWADLYADIAPGGVPLPYPVALIFDDTLGPVVIGPAGNYEVPRGTQWRGLQFSGIVGQVLVDFADGVTFNRADGTVGIDWVELNVTLRSLSTTPVLTPTVADQQIVLIRGGILTTAGTAPFVLFNPPPGSVDLVICFEGGRIDTGPVPVVEAIAGNTIMLGTGPVGQIQADTIAGPVGSTLIDLVIATGGALSATQTFFLGTVSAVFFTNAARLGYSAAVPADWAGVSPVTVAEALDRLAAHVGPVP